MVIANTVYEGKTKDSIGIGSSVADFASVYGGTPPVYDPTPPPAWLYDYDAYGIAIYTDSAQTEIIEIQIDENGTPPSAIPRKKQRYTTNY